MIEIRGLTKTYRQGDIDVHALRGVNLSVAKGEFLSVVGPSGSGKSTLFNILGGLTPPTSGSIHIDGRDLLKMRDAERTDLRKRTVGFVFQKYNLLPTLTAEDNIAIARDIANNTDANDPKFDEILSLLGIRDRMHHKPRALSGGEQQRVAIARALVTGPSVLLADEPTGDLDEQNAWAVFELLERLHRTHKLTSLIATHNLALAARCDRILALEHGVLRTREAAASASGVPGGEAS